MLLPDWIIFAKIGGIIVTAVLGILGYLLPASKTATRRAKLMLVGGVVVAACLTVIFEYIDAVSKAEDRKEDLELAIANLKLAEKTLSRTEAGLAATSEVLNNSLRLLSKFDRLLLSGHFRIAIDHGTGLQYYERAAAWAHEIQTLGAFEANQGARTSEQAFGRPSTFYAHFREDGTLDYLVIGPAAEGYPRGAELAGLSLDFSLSIFTAEMQPVPPEASDILINPGAGAIATVTISLDLGRIVAQQEPSLPSLAVYYYPDHGEGARLELDIHDVLLPATVSLSNGEPLTVPEMTGRRGLIHGKQPVLLTDRDLIARGQLVAIPFLNLRTGSSISLFRGTPECEVIRITPFCTFTFGEG